MKEILEEKAPVGACVQDHSMKGIETVTTGDLNVNEVGTENAAGIGSAQELIAEIVEVKNFTATDIIETTVVIVVAIGPDLTLENAMFGRMRTVAMVFETVIVMSTAQDLNIAAIQAERMLIRIRVKVFVLRSKKMGNVNMVKIVNSYTELSVAALE